MGFNELEGANALISAIEAMYPNWHKFKNLAEAVAFHSEHQNALIRSLRMRINELTDKIHKNFDAPYDQNYKYLAVVAGGIGPNVWDKEVSVYAPNIAWAIRLIEEKFKSDEVIISIEQMD